jgi:hypothetical protein
MDIFGSFALLLAGGFLVSAFLRQRILDPAAYQKSLTLLLAALILYYPVSVLFAVGVYLGFVARPVGFVLGVLSFRLFVMALIAPPGPRNGAGTGAS